MRSTSLVIGAVIVAAAGYTGFVSLFSSPPEMAKPGVNDAPGAQRQTAALSQKDERQFFDSIAAAGPGAGVKKAAPRGPEQWKEMARKFDSATSLRAFFYEAIQKPEQGGYFYAMSALGRCRDAKRINPANPASVQERAAYEISARCDFSEQEARDAFQQFGAIRGTELDDDPLLRQMFAFTRAKTEAARIDVLASTFDSNNPQAIRSVITSGVEKLVRSRLGEDAQSAQLAEYGLDLVECQLGASCGEKSDRALDLCAKNGWCADSVPNALRIGLGDNYSKLASVSSEVVQHLTARHFRFFVPDA